MPGAARADDRSEWDLRWLLFSFRGRAHRAHYWTGIALFFFAWAVLLGTATATTDTGTDSGNPVLGLLALTLLVVGTWAGLAISVKRWHDRAKSGAWILIAFVPFIGPLWAIIEPGFFPGTPGPNPYGSDPRR